MEILGLAFAGKVLMVALKPGLPKDLTWLLRAIIPPQKLQRTEQFFLVNQI